MLATGLCHIDGVPEYVFDVFELQPLRVIVDSKQQTPPSARMLAPPGRVLVYAAEALASLQAALVAVGAEIAFVPGASGKVDQELVVDVFINLASC